ncbi:hypothetical protein QBC34DRAFT_380125 [Podospora aff. communis PSN243]|uniref:Uncharacterized protein n=1 Tax=Podospora aff. communis PSN243 TaxID=3040156 RepID=A0AAV9GQQ4_9PEZI|nr:hypothetical protein QBC34DRAFT_380125 [Podospora aff. communis PSN243]
MTLATLECPGYNGFFVCDAVIGGGCCPFGYLCDHTVTTQCRLTLKLNERTEVVTTTSGPVTGVYTTTFIEGPSLTAAHRIATATTDPNPGQMVVLPGGASLTPLQQAGIAGGSVAGFLVLVGASAWIFWARKRRELSLRGRGNEEAGFDDEKKEEGDDVTRHELVGHCTVEMDVESPAAELQAARMDHELGAHEIAEMEGSTPDPPQCEAAVR